VAHGEIMAFRYFAAYSITGVIAVLQVGKFPDRAVNLGFALIQQYFVLNVAQFLFILSNIRNPVRLEILAVGGVRHQLAVDVELLVHIGDLVARQADDALDVVHRGVHGIAEHHHIAALRRTHLDDLLVDDGQADAIAELVDQDKVSRLQRGQHGTRRDAERLDHERAQHEHKQDHWKEADRVLHPPRHAGGGRGGFLAQARRFLGIGRMAGVRRRGGGLCALRAPAPQYRDIQGPDDAGYYQQHKKYQCKIRAHGVCRLLSLLVFDLQNGQESLLRDFYAADLLHALLAGLLLFKQLLLAGDVAAVALGQYVLAQRLDVLARDDFGADGRLDGHVEHLARDQAAHAGDHVAGPVPGIGAVHDHGERVDLVAVDEQVDPDHVGRAVLEE